MTELATQRLALRPVALADLPALHGLWSDPEVRRFLFDDRVISQSDARELIEASEQNFQTHGLGVWCVARSLVGPEASDELVGFAGFLFHEATPSLLYGIRGRDAGKGFATEAAVAVLSHATRARGVRRIVADVDEPNVASVRVLEKLGMTRTRRELVNGAPLLYFELVVRAPSDA